MTIDQLAKVTQNAYSFSAYGEAEWLKTAKMLRARGFTLEEVEAVLRSKLTRWCRDAFSKNDEGKSSYLELYLDKYNYTQDKVRKELL